MVSPSRASSVSAHPASSGPAHFRVAPVSPATPTAMACGCLPSAVSARSDSRCARSGRRMPQRRQPPAEPGPFRRRSDQPDTAEAACQQRVTQAQGRARDCRSGSDAAPPAAPAARRGIGGGEQRSHPPHAPESGRRRIDPGDRESGSGRSTATRARPTCPAPQIQSAPAAAQRLDHPALNQLRRRRLPAMHAPRPRTRCIRSGRCRARDHLPPVGQGATPRHQTSVSSVTDPPQHWPSAGPSAAGSSRIAVAPPAASIARAPGRTASHSSAPPPMVPDCPGPPRPASPPRASRGGPSPSPEATRHQRTNRGPCRPGGRGRRVPDQPHRAPSGPRPAPAPASRARRAPDSAGPQAATASDSARKAEIPSMNGGSPTALDR